ncbi:SDR family oxidoreductase [Wenjunlia vitaminophila]|uniref:Oxidoreductase n=1 Tax=Wenjunlia vitaminophila TaxID=76728 RepID=A3R4Q6_WENVI|nr:SDR family oxidoreductase [Wenjunlia vitaminophila]ABO15851.1 oxidoreductase [Wenjunlia vitaminophila]
MRPSAPDQGSVVITGASTGIGRACALHLAENGFQVFAGVRKEADGASLERDAKGSLRALLLDVTDQEQIEAAAAEVSRSSGGKLRCLVNNAGIGIPAPTELVDLDLLRRQFEVNVFGQVAVTQEFLPLLRAATGRIVNMGSIADRLTMPFAGPLNSSKHALASLNDALRFELRPWGIHVVLIEPAAIRSAAADGVKEHGQRLVDGLSPRGRHLYEDALRSMLSAMSDKMGRIAAPPSTVAKVVHRAITVDRPKTRYLVGKPARPLAAISKVASDRAFDMIKARIFDQPRGFGSRGADVPDDLESVRRARRRAS